MMTTYVEKLEQDLVRAYKMANERAHRSASRFKTNYDKKVREATVKPGDSILSRNDGVRRKRKLADVREETLFVAQDQPDKDIPVFDVKPEVGVCRTRRLHRNKLLRFLSLPAPGEQVVEDVSRTESMAVFDVLSS